MYDVVYPLKPQDDNPELLYSLRSLCRFGRNFGQVWVVGYRPCWLKHVRAIRVVQTSDKWLNTRRNLDAVCLCDEVSEDFILMNDDFILTQEISDWDLACNVYLGTLRGRSVYYRRTQRHLTRWQAGFQFNHELLRSLSISRPLNYEFHGPVIMNRLQRLEMYEKPEIKPYVGVSEPLLFNRSLFCNLYPRGEGRKLSQDGKLFSDLPGSQFLARNRFISVADGMIGNDASYPLLNSWLKDTFHERCEFEPFFRGSS